MIHRLLTLVLVTVSVLAACSGPVPETSGSNTVSFDGVIDDFEGTATTWIAGGWPLFADSSATRTTVSTRHATRGAQSIQLSFDKGSTSRAIFIQNRSLNLSVGKEFAFDLFNENGAAESVSIAFIDGSQWQESLPIPLKPGSNAVQFDLTASTFRTSMTDWQYTATLQRAEAIHQLVLVLSPVNTGSVFVDKLILVTKTAPQATANRANDTDDALIKLRPAMTKTFQYARLDFDISTTLSVSNTFDTSLIAIEVQLASPSGMTTTIPAFTYQSFSPDGRVPSGPQQWSARFSPTEEGDWTATAILTTTLVQGIHASSPMSFTVFPAVSRGFVRVNPSNPRYLAFDNKEAFFPIGINLAWGHDEPLKDFARWFDALQQNGSSVARIWMSSWSFGIEWKDLGLGRYRLDRAWLLDQVMQMAEKRGVYIILVLINHGAFNIRVNPEWVDNPYNAELGGPCKTPDDFADNATARQLFKQRLRYIAARWAYSPNLLAWEWWNEVNFTPFADPNLLRPWLKEMTAYMRTVDPYHHLTSISYSDANDPRIISMPELDMLQQHLYSAYDPRISMPKALREMGNGTTRSPEKPVLFTEFGYSGSGEQPTRFDNEGIQFHNGLWAATFTGYASAAMYWWWDNYIEPNHYWYHLKGLSQFLADQDLSLLAPWQADVLTNTVQVSALGKEDVALVWLRSASFSVDVIESEFRMATMFNKPGDADWKVNFPSRKDITVQLIAMKAGTYRVGWYDTRTDNLVASQSAAAVDGRLEIIAPAFERDIAAKVIYQKP